MKNFRFIALSVFFIFALLSSCRERSAEPKAKYVFLFIGDGMGLAQVTATEAYQSSLHGQEFTPLVFSEFPAIGMATTFAANRFITGSAAAGTAFATGHKTDIGRISMSMTGDTARETIAEQAKSLGKKVGIISSVSLDHATPAVFYAHQLERQMYREIGLDLAESDFDFFGGGGFLNPGEGDDNVIERAVKKGYQYINDKEGFMALSPDEGKVLFVNPELTREASMYYAIDQDEDYISLADITQKAIEYLDNENGFFIMVEGGKIDWLCHANDAGAMVREVIDFAEAVEEAVRFYKMHPDETLIIVTADHETGGLALGNNTTQYISDYSLLSCQKLSGEAFNNKLAEWRKDHTAVNNGFEAVLPLFEEYFGFGDTNSIVLTEMELENLRSAFIEYDSQDGENKKYSMLTYLGTGILATHAGLGWAARSHTAIRVPVYAIGVNEDAFSGNIDNTDVPKIIWDVIQ